MSNARTEPTVPSAELLLHPVRMRILQALLGDRELTTAQIIAELPDVSTATVYRQIATLYDGGVLEVVDERKVRGTFERTYRLRQERLDVSRDELAAMSRDEHAQAFVTFVTGLLGSFERYLEREDIDLERDRVGYRHNALHLTHDELAEFLNELREVVLPRLGLPAEGRRRYMFSTVLMPADKPDA
jgi:DNA-binding transcriptional ArsR family regulator